MRLNITVGGTAKNGYYNIDPIAEKDDGTKLAIPMHDLSKIVEDSECTEIIVEDSLCYLPHDHVAGIVAHWISKLRHKGLLIITDFDIREVVKRYIHGSINLEQFNEVVHSSSTPKRNGTDMRTISMLLSRLGMQIVSKKIDSSKFTIVARRP